MRIEILFCLLLFCCLRTEAQTGYMIAHNPGSLSGPISWQYPIVQLSDTTQPKKHWHSWALNKELDENVKDSGYKYWKIGMEYMDSAREAQAQRNMLHFRYYARKAEEAHIKSAKYVEKQ